MYLCNKIHTNDMQQKPYHIIFIAIAALLITGCKGESSTKRSDIPEAMVRTHGDSIALATRFTGDFERFLAVTDSLADAGELSQIRANGYRGVGYFQLGQIDKSIESLQNAIADENPPAADFWEYIHAGTNLVIILNSQRNYNTAMRVTLRLIDKLKQVDSPMRATELQTLYLCLGDTEMMLERRDEAIESYNEAYQWVLRTRNNETCRPLAASIETLENIAVTHINHRMEAGIWVDRMDSLVGVYEVQPKAIDKEIKAFRALVLLHRAQVCQLRGEAAEAARYYAKYNSTDYGNSLEGRINGCDYLVEAHRYTEAADNYTQLDHFIKEWGYEYDLETIGKNLLPKLRSNYYTGRRDSALRTAMQIAEVYDSALLKQKQRDAAELATIYDVQGKERQIVEQRADKRLLTAISIAVAILALLILGFAVYVFRQWRATKEKNRIMARQITEAVEYREKLRETRPHPLPVGRGVDTSTAGKADNNTIYSPPLQGGDGGEPLSISDFTTLDDEQLFLCLRDLIENERLFLQPDFGRQTLIEHTGLTKEQIGAAFSQGSDSNSLPAYVRELRLDHAVRVMNEQPDISVEQVSLASGFTSADTFTRNFRTKYGMTPTAYKQTKINE